MKGFLGKLKTALTKAENAPTEEGAQQIVQRFARNVDEESLRQDVFTLYPDLENHLSCYREGQLYIEVGSLVWLHKRDQLGPAPVHDEDHEQEEQEEENYHGEEGNRDDDQEEDAPSSLEQVSKKKRCDEHCDDN